jgi:hypothetical protein
VLLRRHGRLLSPENSEETVFLWISLLMVSAVSQKLSIGYQETYQVLGRYGHINGVLRVDGINPRFCLSAELLRPKLRLYWRFYSRISYAWMSRDW